LSAGSTTVDAITAKIYPQISNELAAMARESVLAHLMKLETEGRAISSGSDWSTVK
jgi:hypothetical protein